MLFRGRGSHMYHWIGRCWTPIGCLIVSIVTTPLSAMVWLQFAVQILTGIPTPKSPLYVGDWGLCLVQWFLLGTTRLSLPNDISFHPTSVTDVQTYHAKVTCRSRWNCCLLVMEFSAFWGYCALSPDSGLSAGIHHPLMKERIILLRNFAKFDKVHCRI